MAVDGTPDENYLVDLATIQPDRAASIDVRKADEVENNLENFENMAFMRMFFAGDMVQLSSIDQVKKAVADGTGDPLLSDALR